MWNKRYSAELKKRRIASMSGGGAEKLDKQYKAGKLSARERLEILFDEGTFIEIENFVEARINEYAVKQKRVVGDGVVIGYGKIDGRLVFAASEDFTVMGGTLGESHSKKMCHIMDMAYKMRAPYVCIQDSGGARIEEGVCSLAGYSGIFYRNTRASGVIPKIAVVLGPCAGGACYSPAICDFVITSEKTSKMFITGPGVVKSVTGEVVSLEDLGGADMHSKKSGVNHFVFKDDEECLKNVRKLLSYLPQNNEEKPQDNFSIKTNSEPFENLVPENQRKAYDTRTVIDNIVDDNTFFEIQENFAKNIVIGFGRLNGSVIGIVANQPMHLAGALDCDASDKTARFVRFCDCFNIPLLTLVDVTGFLPGLKQEQNGIIRHGAKILYAYAEATVPKISLILRKAYGGAYIAMNSKNMGADMVFAWPISQIAVMGAEGAVDIIYKKEMQEAENYEIKREELIKEYNEHFMTPYIAAQFGYIDEVIEADETRSRLIVAFDMLKSKKTETISKKHGNIPL